MKAIIEVNRAGAAIRAYNDAAHPIRRPIDHGTHLGAEFFDDCHRRMEQADLDAAEPVDAAARAVLVAEPHDDTLNTAAPARQHKPQSTPFMLGQCARNRKSQAPLTNRENLRIVKLNNVELRADARVSRSPSPCRSSGAA